MNQEKIKELAKQAGYLPDMFGVSHWDMPEFKRFAELIVNECVSICLSSAGKREYNAGRIHCASEIRDAFEIKYRE